MALLACFVVLPTGLATQASGQQLTRADFDETMQQWKAVCKEVRRFYMEFRTCEEHEADGWRKKWVEAIKRGDQLYLKAVDQAEQVYAQSDQPDPQLGEFLDYLRERYFESGQYDRSLEAAQSLVAQEPDNSRLVFHAARSAFFGNRFSDALSLLDRLQALIGELPRELKSLDSEIRAYQKAWEREHALRVAEAEADDLPRVRLETTKGVIEIELFENEVPNSVASFIHLVESGFYDGLKFHRVIDHFVAHGGCPAGTGQGGPDYRTDSERASPEARQHFTGAVTLCSTFDGKYAGSQFQILKTPTPGFDGVHTVIGRVISGMDVLNRLNATLEQDPTGKEVTIEDVTPDQIAAAKVIRKRDHAYEPVKIR